MAHQDYINKKRPQPKRKKQPPKKPFPFMLVVLALVLLAGFGYGLWYITHNEPAPTHAVKKPTPKAEKPKPVKPVTPEFIDAIKDHEVKVDVKEIEQGGPYQMQCGSFRTADQAEEMKARIAFAGLSSEIRRTEGKNGVWYRVRLGPYDTKRQAESDKNKLKRAKIVSSCPIWGWT